MFKKSFKLGIIFVLLALILSGCTWPWKKAVPPVDNNPSGNLQPLATDDALKTNDVRKFTSEAELQKFLEDNLSGSGSLGREAFALDSSQGLALKSAPMVSSEGLSNSSPASGDGGGSNPTDYSGTNNQVAGVDEADIIKTDGTYIYAVARNELFIIKAWPTNEAQIISKITFKSRPTDIFINGTSLAVFGADDQLYMTEVFQSFRRQNSYTFLKVFDLADPLNPKLVRDLDFEGYYSNSRMIGDYLYLITNNYAAYIEDEPLTPRVLDEGAVLSRACASTAKCFAPDVYYFDIPYNSYNYTSVTAVNLKNSSEPISGQVYLLDGNQNIYVSASNIYITYTTYLNEYDLEQLVKRDIVFARLSAADQDKIKQIEAAPSFVLTKDEKKYKITQIIDRYLSSLEVAEGAILADKIDTALTEMLKAKAKDLEKTVIYKIAVEGGKIEYRAKGEVSGQVLNQFSMDENGNYFRLATTRSQTWSRLYSKPEESYSNVYILDANLKLVGQLENLATSERIYAARFMGDRLYLVTFKQTDPLYAISLADPAKPAVLGAIKIPGFSNYLHPVNKEGTKLIGLGRETTEDTDGRVQVKGLKLSLFDFSDLAKPQELDTYLIGDERSDSIALSDHKAFLYSEAKNLLVIPAALRENNGRLSFGGAFIFNINENKFSLQGRLDHSAGGNFAQSDYWQGFNYYDNTVKRSLYINDSLYTLSNKFLKINKLADLTETASLILTTGGDDYIITPEPRILPGTIETPPDYGEAGVPAAESGSSTDDLGAPGESSGSSTPALGL